MLARSTSRRPIKHPISQEGKHQGEIIAPVALTIGLSMRLRLWWVLACLQQQAAQIGQAWAIELQSRNRCAARRRQTNHQTEIVVPGEMFFPTLGAWVEQRGSFS